MDKKDLRKKYKEIRSKLKGKITDKFYENDIYKNAKAIFTFVSYGSEIDTIELINRALKDNKVVAVPFITNEKHKMVFIKINSLEELKPNKIGILEPEYREDRVVDSERNTVIIVPALVFDREFYRIGYGGGYYDKYIDENECMCTVGVCFEEQITDKVPRDEFDRKVDVLVTDVELKIRS